MRYDLASGRELGTLLASAAAASGGGGGGGGGGEGFEFTCMAAGCGLVAAAGEGGDVFLWDSRVGPRGGSSDRAGGGGAGGGAVEGGCAPAMTLHVSGAARVLSLSLGGGGGGGGGGARGGRHAASSAANLALVASNGARVFDLRMSGRPLRLTSREPGQRWVAAAHTAANEPMTLSAAGDVTAWTSSPPHAPLRTFRGVAAAAARGARAVLAVSRPAAAATVVGDAGTAGDGSVGDVGDVGDVRGCLVLTAGGERGEGARVWDATTGGVVAEWGTSGEQHQPGSFGGGGGGGGGYYDARGFSWADEARPCLFTPPPQLNPPQLVSVLPFSTNKQHAFPSFKP